MNEQTYTRWQYLVIKTMQHGTPALIAQEAVASVALAHPDWDLQEKHTWDEWEER